MGMTDPFTRTPGVAGKAYIESHNIDRIINEFDDEESYKFVYKIVGLRGAGKSVAYSKIIKAFKEKKNWRVYTLSAAGNPTETLIAKLSEEKFIDADRHSSSFGATAEVSGNMPIISGTTSINFSRSKSKDEHYYAAEAELAKMIDVVNAKGIRILIGIDDIAKTPEMVSFLSIFGSLLLEEKKVYLLCTGVAKNIEDFSDAPNLTFFKRSDCIEVKELDKYDVSSMYQKLLDIDEPTAVRLAKFVKGYAYAYQVLGSLYYNKGENTAFETLLPEFDRIMSRDSYDLIWKSLTAAEQELVRIIVNSSGKTAEIKTQMDKPGSYSALRDRLAKKHLINIEERGIVEIRLPRFREFVNLWWGTD